MKWFAVGILVLVLAACGNDKAEDKPKSEPETNDKEEVEMDKKEDGLTATEIIEKALAASADQNSMHLTMDINHNTSVPEHDFTSDTKMNIESDLIVKPFALHQVTKTNIADEEMDLEWYATDDAFYLYNTTEELWLDMPEEDKDEIIGDFSEEIDQFLFLELFEEFSNEFTVDETDDAYTVKLESSGDKFDAIITELIVDELLAEFEEDEEVDIKNLNVKNITLEFSIAKETFYTNGFDLNLDTSLELDGVEMIFTQKTTAAVSKINEIEEIEIPQEVIESALKYDEADFEEVEAE